MGLAVVRRACKGKTGIFGRHGDRPPTDGTKEAHGTHGNPKGSFPCVSVGSLVRSGDASKHQGRQENRGKLSSGFPGFPALPVRLAAEAFPENPRNPQSPTVAPPLLRPIVFCRP